MKKITFFAFFLLLSSLTFAFSPLDIDDGILQPSITHRSGIEDYIVQDVQFRYTESGYYIDVIYDKERIALLQSWKEQKLTDSKQHCYVSSEDINLHTKEVPIAYTEQVFYEDEFTKEEKFYLVDYYRCQDLYTAYSTLIDNPVLPITKVEDSKQTTLSTKQLSASKDMDSQFLGQLQKGDTLKLGTGTIDISAISDVYMWYDPSNASSYTLDGNGNVSELRDLSGNNFHMIQATAGNRPNPIFNDPTYQNLTIFNYQASNTESLYANETTAVNYNWNNGFTAFIVYDKSTASSTATQVFGRYPSSGLERTWEFRDGSSNNNDFARANGAATFDNFNIDTGTYYRVLVARHTASVTYIYQQNSSTVIKSDALTGSLNTDNSLPFTIMGREDGTRSSNGKMGEILIYARALNATEQATVQEYLYCKWITNVGCPQPPGPTDDITLTNSTQTPSSPQTYPVSNIQFDINVTAINSTIDTVIFNWNGTNNTVTAPYQFNITNPAVGNYSFYWWANNTNGTSNQTAIDYYIVNQGTPSLSIDSSAGFSFAYGVSTTLTGLGCPSQLTCTLYVDGTPIANPTTDTFGLGTYNITFNTTGNQNYTAATASQTLTVTQGTPTLSISRTPTGTIFEGTQTTVTGLNCPSELTCILYRNGVNVSNPDVATLSAGAYTYIFNTTGNVNLSAASVNLSFSVLTPSNTTGTPYKTHMEWKSDQFTCTLQFNEIFFDVDYVEINVFSTSGLADSANMTNINTGIYRYNYSDNFDYAICSYYYPAIVTEDIYINGGVIMEMFTLLVIFSIGAIMLFLAGYLQYTLFYFSSGIWFVINSFYALNVLDNNMGFFIFGLVGLGILYFGYDETYRNRKQAKRYEFDE